MSSRLFQDQVETKAWFFNMFLMNWLWLLIFLDLLAKKSLAMHSKRQGPDRSWDDASKRFRANLDDLFLSNEISATRAQTLYSDGAACGHKWKKRAKVGQVDQTHPQRSIEGDDFKIKMARSLSCTCESSMPQNWGSQDHHAALFVAP